MKLLFALLASAAVVSAWPLDSKDPKIPQLQPNIPDSKPAPGPSNPNIDSTKLKDSEVPEAPLELTLEQIEALQAQEAFEPEGEVITEEEIKAEDEGKDIEAKLTETDTKTVMETETMPAPPSPPTDMDETAVPVEDGNMMQMAEGKVPKAPKASVRRLIGQYKMRFFHAANKEQLEKIMMRKGVIGFLRAVFKLNEDGKAISLEEWMKMYEELSKYWSQHLGIKIPVTKEQWATVAKKDAECSIRKDIIPAIFFEKDRALFDAVWSAFFLRLFDFNQDGLINDRWLKNVKGVPVTEQAFHKDGVKWAKDILALPVATEEELMKEMQIVQATQGEEMVKEMVKMMKVEGIVKADDEDKSQIASETTQAPVDPMANLN